MKNTLNRRGSINYSHNLPRIAYVVIHIKVLSDLKLITYGNKLKLQNIILAENGRNAIFRFTNYIKFNPKKENILCGTTPEGKLAYFNADDFKNIKQTSGEYTFEMKVCNVPLSAEEISEILFSKQ